ncbi:MAG: hydroxyacid dehydrogenase [Candidatus Diapherotrites archaeon]|nr:hydroxyacid dehydrogenase [Candidatus Diapherotrites archaeon]
MPVNKLILIADPISDTAVQILSSNGIKSSIKLGLKEEELIKLTPDYDGIIVRSRVKITKQVLESGARGKLKIVGRAGVGVDNIDKEAAKALGIVVENTPFGNTNAAAEHTLALMILLSKHIIHSHNSMKQGKWDRKNFEGTELKGKTLGLIGFGNVGKKVAKVALAFEMKVLAYDPFVDSAKLAEIGVKKAELEEIYIKADYITVHVPLTDKTRNMISKKEFDKMSCTRRSN